MTEPKGLAGLPPKVFNIVVDMLDTVKSCHRSERDEEFLRTENRTLRNRTLKDLSLVSESVRKLAQPLIFHHVLLALYPMAIKSRAEDLIRLIEARPESTSWLKKLHI